MPDNYAQAAIRHLNDAEHLAASARHDNAGHLIGFAAECAIKVAAAGFFRPGERIDGHLPNKIKNVIRAKLQGRGITGQLLALVDARSSFFAEWDIEARYWDDGSITPEKYAVWLKDAKRAFGIAKIRS